MQRPPGSWGYLRIPITLAVILGLLSVVFIYCHAFLFKLSPSRQKELEFAAAVIGGAAAVYAGYYTAATIKVNTAQSRTAASFDFLRERYQLAYSTIRTKLLKEIKIDGTVSGSDIHRKIVSDSELHLLVTNTLAYFEVLSIAIQSGYAEERVLYYSICGTACLMHKILDHYIQEERKINPSYYVEFSKLVNAWKAKKSLLTGGEYQSDTYSDGSG
jgi:hypothetical protein